MTQNGSSLCPQRTQAIFRAILAEQRGCLCYEHAAILTILVNLQY